MDIVWPVSMRIFLCATFLHAQLRPYKNCPTNNVPPKLKHRVPRLVNSPSKSFGASALAEAAPVA